MPDELRKDPEKILKEINSEENNLNRGKLKIFFGMCAGVGKTYAMLEAAQKARKAGVDVVLGIVETHGRLETEKLVAGLEVLPLKQIEYRGSTLKEFDLDGMLARSPQIALIDELAHSNVAGSRHAKRWTDVMELLAQGIDVYTTLNVQHLESRSDTVKQITGVVIRETIPDNIFEQSNEIELIDITPLDLLQRLNEGKVYTPEQSKQAIGNFFRQGNLIALREMALRLTADRVDYQLRDYKSKKNISETWKSGQRLMVAISGSPYSAELIKWTKRFAYTIEAGWIAVHILNGQTPDEKNNERLKKNFDLAKELGAEIITSADLDVVTGLLRVARENNVTQIIIGKTGAAQGSMGNNFVKRLLKESGDIDVTFLSNEGVREKKPLLKSVLPESSLYNYLINLFIIASVSVFCYSYPEAIGYQAVSLLMLLIISVMSVMSSGIGPIIVTSIISAFIWDYFFIPPKFTLHIAKPEDILMFILFFVVAIVNGTLNFKIKRQEKLVRDRENRTSALYKLSSNLQKAENSSEVVGCFIENLKEALDADIAFYLADTTGKVIPNSHPKGTYKIEEDEINYVNWSLANKQTCGRFTNTLPSSKTHFVPLVAGRIGLGVVCIRFSADKKINFEQELLLQSFITQGSTALEKERLNEIATKTLVVEQSEKLYKTLFNSLSHELRTPITTIIGAAGALTESSISAIPGVVTGIAHEIGIAAERLNRLVGNLLDMTRLESGRLKPKFDWYDINDLLGAVAKRIKSESDTAKIVLSVPENIQPIRFDFGLIEQAICNILHNCIIYAGNDKEITIFVTMTNIVCRIVIKDLGPGFPNESIDKLFDKFYRLPGSVTGGTGLGLSISKGFIEAHGGTISARNGVGGGAEFVIELPNKG